MDARRMRGRARGSRWMVERERCRIEDPEPPAPPPTDQPLGDVVGALIRKLGMGQAQGLDGLVEAWPEMVGEAVARHSRPGYLAGTELAVYVDSSVWLSELSRWGRSAILAKVQARYGKQGVRSIRLQLDPDG